MKEKLKDYKWLIPEGIVTAAIVLGLTGLFYGLFAVHLISGHEAMTPEVRRLITADHINIVTELICQLCYGFLMVFIYRWARFKSIWSGGIAGILIAVLSDYYYALALYSTTKNMFTITSISIDAMTYAMVGFVTGILLTAYLHWYDKKVGNTPEKLCKCDFKDNRLS